jgi:flagellar hook assembly protein FlgD
VSSAKIHVVLPVASNVSIRIVDAAGRRVRDLRQEWLPAGAHEMQWDGSGSDGAPVPAGLYFVRLAANGEVRAARLLRLR